jgi:hypothetical protein
VKAVKTIAALIFLTALGIVLIQPVLGADDGAEPTKRKAAAGAEPSEPADPDDGDEANEEDPADEPAFELTARYPRRCVRRVPAASTGLLAARRGSRVTIGLPGGGIETTAAVEGDAAWSPSGRYLAERGGQVYDATGAPVGTLFFRPVRWQWSPVADCALAVTEAGKLTFSIPATDRRGIQLVDAPVADFELSPNGRRVAVVTRDTGLWVAKLRSGKTVHVTGGPASLVGWYSNRSVLYSKSEGSGKLRYATGRRARVVKGAFATASLARCEGRTLLVALATESDAPLAELVSRDGRIEREVLAAPAGYAGFSGASCSPDGGFVVASAQTGSGGRGPLVLLQSDGTFVRELMRGRTANPTWTSQGVVFVKFGAAGRGRLWFIPPNGAAPVETPHKVGAPNQYDWAAGA